MHLYKPPHLFICDLLALDFEMAKVKMQGLTFKTTIYIIRCGILVNNKRCSGCHLSGVKFMGRIMEIILMIFVGIALSASVGFRIFVPFLVVSLATYTGHLSLAQDFVWIGSLPALICFSIATIFEIAAYYIPWLDNLLDTVAIPLAIVAGTVLTASFVSEMSPVLRWSLAIIAGGGAAGVTKVVSSTIRAVSTGVTGGFANSIFTTVETGISSVIAIFSVALPYIGISLALLILIFLSVKFIRRAKKLRRA